jgi:hypothetical protein
VKQSVKTIRVKDSIQNVNQSFEDDDHDQLLTPERSSRHDTSKLIDYRQIDSKTSEFIDIINRQIDLKKDRHQMIDNLHTNMKTSLSVDRSQKMNNLHNVMKKSQSLIDSQRVNNLHISMKKSQQFDRSQEMRNLHTDMKESQSFDRQSFHSFRASQSFQSAISTTKLFTLSREERSLFESVRSLIIESIRSNSSNNSLINSLIKSNEPRRHSVSDLSRVEIHSSSLMKRINEISTDQTSLEITDIFERLNIANKIEKVKEIVKEKDKTKDQFKSSKPSSSRSIESSDLNSANIIENKRNRKLNFKYAQLVYEE